jgi:hypothetical protein
MEVTLVTKPAALSYRHPGPEPGSILLSHDRMALHNARQCISSVGSCAPAMDPGSGLE